MNYEQARRAMVDGQIRTSDVIDIRLLATLLDVPRERFVPESWREMAYADAAIPFGPGGRAMLRPMVLAKFIQAAGITPQDVILDVGCGLGYSSAVLARLGAFVVALEEDEALARAATANLAAVDAANAVVVTAPLSQGYADNAPYDVIMIQGGVEVIPDALTAQLKPEGRLLALSGDGVAAKAMVYQNIGGVLSGRAVFDAPANVLPGFERPRQFTF